MTPPDKPGTEMASAYLDDELAPPDAKAFEDLLAASPRVQGELADLRKVVSLVGSLGSVDAPEDFYDKLNRRIRRRQLLEPRLASKFAAMALPFQVLSLLVILAVAALYMMSELASAPASIERELSEPMNVRPGHGAGLDGSNR